MFLMKAFFSDMMLDLWENFSDVFWNILVMLGIMILGFIISWVIRKLLEKLLIIFRFDKWAEGVGITTFLERGGVKSQPSTIISRIVFWILIVTFFSFGLTIVGLPQFTEYASRITSALPYIVISTIIVIVGMIFSTFLSRVIYMACENANIGYGDVISKSVRILLVIITFAIVFEYLGLGSTIISISFLIVFGGVILALSLALGVSLSGVITEFIRQKMAGNRNRKRRTDTIPGPVASSDHYPRSSDPGTALRRGNVGTSPVRVSWPVLCGLGVRTYGPRLRSVPASSAL